MCPMMWLVIHHKLLALMSILVVVCWPLHCICWQAAQATQQAMDKIEKVRLFSAADYRTIHDVNNVYYLDVPGNMKIRYTGWEYM